MAPTSVQAHPSGIGVIDTRWDGFRRGGTYLVHGRTTHAYRVLPLRFLQMGIGHGEPCLYISIGRPEHLKTHAALVNLDLRQAHEGGLLRVLRFSSAAALDSLDDEHRAQALRDLALIIRRHKPQRVVLDDLRPILGFASPSRLPVALGDLAAQIAPLRATLLLGLTAPEDDATASLFELITPSLSARIRVEESDGTSTARRLTLTPGTDDGMETIVLDVDFAAKGAPRLADVAPAADAVASGNGVARHSQVAASPSLLDRDAFGLHLQHRFHQHAVNGTPFLLIAMRGDDEAAREPPFHPLRDSVRELLGDGDAWCMDEARRRLVVALERHDANDARRFFARLRVRLKTRLPGESATYLQTFTAIVMPDGGPFSTAEEFLTVALDDA